MADELRPASARASAPGSARRCRERTAGYSKSSPERAELTPCGARESRKSSPSGTRERTLRGACWAPVLPNYEDLSARQQNGVNHVDDAVRLVHVADGDLSRAAFGVPDPQLAVLLP